MKKSIKYFLTGIFVMFLFGGSFAQTVTTTTDSAKTLTVEQKTTNALAEVTKITSLTPEQIEKVTPFLNQFYTQKDLDEKLYSNTEQKVVAANKRRELLVSNMKTVLTGEQMDLLIKQWEKFSIKRSDKSETQTTE